MELTIEKQDGSQAYVTNEGGGPQKEVRRGTSCFGTSCEPLIVALLPEQCSSLNATQKALHCLHCNPTIVVDATCGGRKLNGPSRSDLF